MVQFDSWAWRREFPYHINMIIIIIFIIYHMMNIISILHTILYLMMYYMMISCSSAVNVLLIYDIYVYICLTASGLITFLDVTSCVFQLCGECSSFPTHIIANFRMKHMFMIIVTEFKGIWQQPQLQSIFQLSTPTGRSRLPQEWQANFFRNSIAPRPFGWAGYRGHPTFWS